MAVTLQVTDGTTTVDMTTSDNSWRLLDRWEPAVATPTGDGSIPGYVVDVLPVIITPSSDDDLALEMQKLHALAKRAAEYWADDNQTTPVWFHRQLTAETGAARTLVRQIDFDVDTRFGSWIDACPPVTDGRLGNVAITHHPCWEKTSAVAASGTENASVLGGAIDYTDVVGDFAARPYYIRWYGGDVGAVFQYIWMGFRSDARTGSIADASKFVALWECEDGSAGTNAATADVADGSPTGGGGADNVMRVAWGGGTTTWANRWSMSIAQQITSTGGTSPDDIPAYFGTFLVLLRAKVDAGIAQVRTQLRGLGALTSVYGPIVDVSATSWTIYNLGTVTLPMRDRKAIPIALLAASLDDDEVISIWARQKSGTTTALDFDCCVLLPIDEYFVLIGNVGVTTGPIDAYMGVDPTDRWAGISVDTSTDPDRIQDVCPMSVAGPGIPVGDGRAFVCVANASLAAPAYNDNIDVLISTYPRWLSLSGAENA